MQLISSRIGTILSVSGVFVCYYKILICSQVTPRITAGVEEDADDDGRPPPCVGICYYNKLMALEAKEDLTRHNMVYKQVGANKIACTVGGAKI